ncbi:type VI secretion system-associated FHA domain protein TagH [Paraburkholderia silviterrae]|uniref:Type VI secretion system-associated FHA domain protein TagH n=1 Tax=Paraburkholderia silviterrae TaxID=2528715 RepID=A0A4R5M8F5_9BURK|nr:type VI secretion system-associated FHA domain protein TagH [Paraburkholderia silviterrae]TDG21935.1 type VI secretion system-associated FHA domain protein TagH [Paraburkholderia silviterrae]
MQLTVIEYAGEPVRTETSVVFHAPGGTIGRNADNQMVLPDETRQVSRLQALLHIDGVRCVLKNLSSVSVVEINDTPLEYTEEHALESGDAIRIGPYVLRAQAGEDGMAEVAHTAHSVHVDSAHSPERESAGRAPPKESAPPIPTDPLALFARTSRDEAKLARHTVTQTAAQSATPRTAPAAHIDARATTSAKPDTEHDTAPEFLARPPQPRASVPASAASQHDMRTANAPEPREAASSAAHASTPASAQPPSPAPDSADALLSAFLRGAGLDKATCDWSTEQLHTAGQLLALFANGTVGLLSSRSILKREVKADMTVLLDRENNPLKLLPDGSAALRQMFGLPFPGFMTPPSAVEDAFHDLQAHQIAMVAGMRAALNDVLLRFSPERLAERDAPSRYEALLPVLRKVRLWNRYERMHHDTMLAVEDDFSAVFGRSFLRAYDDEVRSYHARRRPARAGDA